MSGSNRRADPANAAHLRGSSAPRLHDARAPALLPGAGVRMASRPSGRQKAGATGARTPVAGAAAALVLSLLGFALCALALRAAR